MFTPTTLFSIVFYNNYTVELLRSEDILDIIVFTTGLPFSPLLKTS
jgi:hypothetical protein